MHKPQFLADWTRPEPADDLDTKLIGSIDRHGWALIDVFDTDGEHPGFTYTAGLLETYGEPELILFALGRDTRKTLLNDCVHRLQNGVGLPVGEHVDGLVNGFPVRFIDADTGRADIYKDYLGWAHWYYGKRQFPVRQFVWPDKEQRFPWEPDCAAACRKLQPMLGSLPV